MTNYRKEFRDSSRTVRWSFGHGFLKVIVPCLLIVMVVIGIGWVVFKPFDIGRKVFNTDNIITQYEWFKQTKEDIEAYDTQIVTAQGQITIFQESMGDAPRTEWGYANTTEYSRLQSVYQGLKNQRNSLVAEYNAKGRMATRSVFKAGDVELPDRIPLAP
jgi:hypothetical protein